ncbi:MAG: NUDIX domain-containing protein [Candidatus Saccharimonadales bacterium]
METVIQAKAVVFTKGSRALLLTRAENDDERPSGLDLPGGGVEAGESMKEGVIREILEETGLTITPQDARLVWSKTVVGHGKNIIRLLYVCKSQSDIVRLSFEHDAYTWVTLEDIADELDHPQWSEGIRYATTNGLL